MVQPILNQTLEIAIKGTTQAVAHGLNNIRGSPDLLVALGVIAFILILWGLSKK